MAASVTYNKDWNNNYCFEHISWILSHMPQLLSDNTSEFIPELLLNALHYL